jgi:glycogen debranching enzyme
MLAGAYAQRTGDFAFVSEIWPALEAAIAWTDNDGDSNRDGFVDYVSATAKGLINQGWKDSADSIFHTDGTMAEGPIALVEVQGYVYAARRAMAWLADRRGHSDRAHYWRLRARQLRVAVEKHFWLRDAGYYAIALDGRGQPCGVRSSNAGQLLYTRLPSRDRAARVIEQLMSTPFSDGWGIRTLASDEKRFNPMSYHNGSIWPHDTALCAAGIAAYGNKDAAVRVLRELFGAALTFDSRLPELYCGFRRRTGEPPVGYPVACLPQAWSSGAVFMLLQACLGITIDGVNRSIHIDRPSLPAEIDRLHVRRLDVHGVSVDLGFERLGDRVTASLLRPVPESIRVQMRV